MSHDQSRLLRFHHWTLICSAVSPSDDSPERSNEKTCISCAFKCQKKTRSCANHRGVIRRSRQVTQALWTTIHRWCDLKSRVLWMIHDIYCETPTIAHPYTHRTATQTHTCSGNHDKSNWIQFPLIFHALLKNTAKKKKENHRKQHSALINHFLSFSTIFALRDGIADSLHDT